MEQIVHNLQRIEQIDLLAKHALFKYQRKLPNKYANINATLQLLHNLIDNFTKKADAYQQRLQNTANITDLDQQIRLHRARIADCQSLSVALNQTVQAKKHKIHEKEQLVNKLRTQLMQLKTDNVKKIILLQNKQKELQLQVDKENRQIRKATWKMKTECSRGQMHSGLSTQYTHDNLLSQQLFNLLDRKKKVDSFIGDIFKELKAKLAKIQRKSNHNGMNGSLMFKMLENDKPCPEKKLKDSNLIIYDVLKRKYKSEKKKQKNEAISVSEQQFMSYTPYQLLGIIELRGGMQALSEAIANYESNHQ